MTVVRWKVGHVAPGGRRIRWGDVAWCGFWLGILALYLAWIVALVMWGGA